MHRIINYSLVSVYILNYVPKCIFLFWLACLFELKIYVEALVILLNETYVRLVTNTACLRDGGWMIG